MLVHAERDELAARTGGEGCVGPRTASVEASSPSRVVPAVIGVAAKTPPMTRRPQAVRTLVIHGDNARWIEVWDAIAGAVIVLALIGIAVFLASPS
jgi:hypothetical protein